MPEYVLGYTQGVGDELKPFIIEQSENCFAEIRKALVNGADPEELDKCFSTKQLKIINKCLAKGLSISHLHGGYSVKEMTEYLNAN